MPRCAIRFDGSTVKPEPEVHGLGRRCTEKEVDRLPSGDYTIPVCKRHAEVGGWYVLGYQAFFVSGKERNCSGKG